VAYASGEGDARALLDDVGRLVGGEVQARARLGEGDLVAHRVGLSAHRAARRLAGRARVRADRGDVVLAEGPLDGGEVGQGAAPALGACAARLWMSESERAPGPPSRRCTPGADVEGASRAAPVA